MSLTTPAARDFVIALRTHVWDEAVTALTAKLNTACPGAELVILADETRRTFETSPFTKIAHNNNYAQFSLPNFPHDKVLWYNADYPLYTLRAARPHASYYAMVEYDVAVNINLTAIIQQAQARRLDLVIGSLRPAGPNWFWTATGAPFFTRLWQSFLPVIIVSGRAIDHMLKRRQEIWQNRVYKSSNTGHSAKCSSQAPSLN